MRRKEKMRNENVLNGKINNGKEISKGSNVLVTNKSYRGTHTSFLSTTLVNDGNGGTNSNDICGEHK